MYWATLFSRVGLVVVLICLPTTLLGSISFGKIGGLIGISIPLIWIFYSALRTELILAKLYGSSSDIPQGLTRSLELVFDSNSRRPLPRLLVFRDPSPNTLIVKSLTGSGTILLSQGMIALLNEEELRAILELCIIRLDEPGIIFQSFCSTLALGILKFAPRAWSNLAFTGRALSKDEERLLSPLSSIGFLILLPIAHNLVNIGRIPVKNRSSIQLAGPYSVAMQKVAQAVHIWGPIRNFGAGLVNDLSRLS
jgi:hypothetical protein